MKQLKAMLLSTLTVGMLAACANTTEGAATGALAGAAGGLVSGLIWGSDPLESAARGAAVGAASGAVVGAVKDAKTPSSNEAPSQPKKLTREELLPLIGEDAVEGVVSLADCEHQQALGHAEKAKASENEAFALAGYWIDAMTYSETGTVDKLNQSYPEIIQRDNSISNLIEAQSALSNSLNQLKQIRKQYGLAESCYS